MDRRRAVGVIVVGAFAMAGAGCVASSAGTEQQPAVRTPGPSASSSAVAPTTTTAGPSTTRTAGPAPREMYAPQPGYDRSRFGSSLGIDNRWFPLVPGRELVYDGQTVEDGERLSHRIVSVVTDLTKSIDGVRTRVVWDRDYSAGKLVEAELSFYAQADDGTVWLFGEYPEEYDDDGRLDAAPTWIHGLADAAAGIAFPGRPDISAPSYAEGWGPDVGWTDRGSVVATRPKLCVRSTCYPDVVTVSETSKGEHGAQQLKSYAAGVGNVLVTYRGKDDSKETLHLASRRTLDTDALAKARTDALRLESRGFVVSGDVYARTSRSVPG